MDNYYRKLVEAECCHIRGTVTITVYEGEAAIKHSRNELSQRNAEIELYKSAVTVNPETGHATDINAFTNLCHNIVDLPCDYTALLTALYDITNIVSDSKYPKENRDSVCEALSYILQHGHLDSCACSSVWATVHTLHRIDEPKPQYDASIRHGSLLFSGGHYS